MINRVILIGRTTKELELKTTSNNLSVVTFTLAVPRAFKNSGGERESDFVQCVVWRKQAESMYKYVRKGNMRGVDGRIQTRTYDDSNGKRVYITEVVCDSIQFLETNKQDSQPTNNTQDKDDNSEKLPF